VQSGPGALTLTAAQNLDTGTLTVSPGATLTLAPIVSNVPAYSTQDFTSITVGSGATLNVATVHTFGYAGGTRPSITINGGTVTNSLGNDNYLGAVTMTGGTINGTGEFRLQNNLSQTASTLTTLPSSTTATVSVSSFALVSYYSNPVIFNISQGTTTSGIDLLITSNIDNSANLTKIGPGVMEITGSDTYSGGTNVSGGTLILASSGAFPANTPLALSGTGLVVAASHTGATKNNIVALGLSISGGAGAWNGQLDLKNNDMIVRGSNYSYTSGSNTYYGDASLSDITSQAAEGYNGGAWNGSGGIVSSTAAADTTHLHALGVISNDNGMNTGTALYTSFDGTATVEGDVLVKYTYYGDANLDGKVDGTDYSRIDSAVLANESSPGSATGWFNGDFNYDGVIDGSDYTLIDNAYNTQGAQISAQVAASSAQIAGVSAVPEPATLGLLGMGAVGLLGRRKRR
jgi:autotransporter-associated beta strand protein